MFQTIETEVIKRLGMLSGFDPTVLPAYHLGDTYYVCKPKQQEAFKSLLNKRLIGNTISNNHFIPPLSKGLLTLSPPEAVASPSTRSKSKSWSSPTTFQLDFTRCDQLECALGLRRSPTTDDGTYHCPQTHMSMPDIRLYVLPNSWESPVGAFNGHEDLRDLSLEIETFNTGFGTRHAAPNTPLKFTKKKGGSDDTRWVGSSGRTEMEIGDGVLSFTNDNLTRPVQNTIESRIENGRQTGRLHCKLICDKPTVDWTTDPPAHSPPAQTQPQSAKKTPLHIKPEPQYL